MKKSLLLLTVVAIVLAMTAAGVSAADRIVFRFAGQQPVEHECTKAMKEFAQRIWERTGGHVKIEVYPTNQLGDYTLIMEELIRGTVDMSITSFASSFDPRFEVVYINGYVSGYDEAKEVFAPGSWLPNKLTELGAPLGVRVLGSYVEGMIGVASTKPIKDPLNPKVDKGVLTRVPNMDTYMLAAQAMGFRTITIPWIDVYQSLQTGVCDSVHGVATATVYTGLGDVVKYWYATNYSMEYLPFMISEKSWQKLSPEEQEIFQEEARNVTIKSIDTAKESDTKYMDLMRKRGIQVFTYTEEELQPLKEACISVWDKLGSRGMTPELMAEFKENLGK